MVNTRRCNFDVVEEVKKMLAIQNQLKESEILAHNSWIHPKRNMSQWIGNRSRPKEINRQEGIERSHVSGGRETVRMGEKSSYRNQTPSD